MRTIGSLLLVLGVLATAAGQGTDGPKPAAKGKNKITVGKETTYLTGPLDKDGYVDYVAALNERLRKGVTPENNANVLLWQALGPHPSKEVMPADYFRWLGIAAPPERGDYFSSAYRYLKSHPRWGTQKAQQIDDELERVRQRPWTAKAYPHLGAWLKANAKPLALVVKASRLSRFYSPWVPARDEKGPTGLLSGPAPSLSFAALAYALTARAMLHVGEEKFADAWDDLLACHRLARLVAGGGTPMEFLAGVALESTASDADLAFLERVNPTARRIENCLRDLSQLAPFPAVADKLGLAERCAFLEHLTLIERHGTRYLDALAAVGTKDVQPFTDRAPQQLDWDTALREANQWYTRLAAAAREPDHAARRKIVTELDLDVKLLKNKVAQWGGVTAFLGSKQARGKMYSETLICLDFPGLLKIQQGDDRIRQIQNNTFLAFALEAYRREHGGYPKALDVLAPKYLKRVPRDVFTGEALIYRPAATGYVLYSVGPNGRDDGGRDYDNDPPGDDVSVRMPLPKR